nr:reverse transcriptase domain, reverse transcriptase zinc-binding domain protein [Tanacetum cinerariifolium]
MDPKTLALELLPAPYIVASRADVCQWRDSNGKFSAFSVAKVWESIRPCGKVWYYVRELAGMDHVLPILHDILASLYPMRNKRTTRSIFGKLLVAASSYFIWLERNNRVFKKVKKSPEDIRDIVMVMALLLTFWFILLYISARASEEPRIGVAELWYVTISVVEVQVLFLGK